MTADPAPLFSETRSVPLAWRNLVANKLRLVRSIAGIGFAVLLMLVQLGFERGFFDASLGMIRELDGELFVMNASKYRFGSEDPFAPASLAPARAVAGVASVTPLYAAWQHFLWQEPGGEKTYLVQAFGFDPDRPVFSIPELREQSEKLKEPDTVIVDRRSRPFLGMDEGAGGTEINGRPVRIVGSYALGPDFMANGTVMMSERTFAALLTGNPDFAQSMPVEFGVVKLQPEADPAAVQQALGEALPDELRVLSKTELEAFEHAFQADLSSAGPIFWMGTIVGFIVGMLISYQIIYTDLSDQLPQCATLKGMGYGSPYLVRVVFQQAAFTAVAAYVPAWLVCLLVYRIIGELALMPLHMTLQVTAISFALTLGMCLVSAALAIRRVIAVDPAEVF
ncbi:MAG: ABC transporter permease [Alphaproteobacteria bacterium]